MLAESSDPPYPFAEVSDPDKLPAEPLISVVMLAYKHQDFLAEAIEGVINQQTQHAYELLIGEDCSPDRTLEVALSYQKKRPDKIRVLHSKRNAGAFENSQRLIKAARGRFIAFCEGDDFWTNPHKLQLQADLLLEDPRITLVHSDFDRLAGQRILRNVQRTQCWPIPEGAAALQILLGKMTVITATAMYRADVLHALRDSGLASPQWPFGDYPKALYAAMQGRVAYVRESTAVYRHVSGSAMNLGRGASVKMQSAAHDCRATFIAISALSTSEKSQLLTQSHRRMLSVATYSGDSALYQYHFEWLAKNGRKPGMAAHAWSWLLMHLHPLLKAVRAFRTQRARLKLLLSYRKV